MQRKSRLKLMGRRAARSAAGFTLVELMVVLVILGLLAGVVVKSLMGRVDIAKKKTAIVQIRELADAIDMFCADNGFYPPNDRGLRALVEKGPNVKVWPADGYLKSKTIPRDPWGNEYLYVQPGAGGPFDILSYGADGREGGNGANGDLTNHTLHEQT